MGNTLFFRARDTGKPIQFKQPDWAVHFDAEGDLTNRNHGFIEGGYWWIEVGYPLHPIKDNEAIRHEALRQLLGLWDHIKNRCVDDEIRARAKTYALEFVGFWPYKRESRRVLGDYILRQEDVQNPKVREDDVAFGCWGIDIHLPGGILNRHVPPYPPPRNEANWKVYGTIPYGIPLRCCYSRNVENLLVAGRPISASYVAFASSRVLPTGAIVGQAVGAAAALCKNHQCAPRTLARQHAAELQQLLLRQDCFIPGIENQDPRDLARGAKVTASSDAPLAFSESPSFYPLRFPSAQLFPVSTTRLDAVELLLKSSLPSPTRLTLGLRKADHVWDFRASQDLAVTSATIAAGHQGFVRFTLNARTEPHRLYYIYVNAQPGVAWALFADREGEPSEVPVGTTPADLPDGDRWRPLTNGKSFSIGVIPEQRPYGPENVGLGASRPDRWTNVYISDPAQPLPAWIELQLLRSARFNHIQVTLDTDTNRRVRLPLFQYPECVKRYDIAVWIGTGWKVVAEERDNYYRRRVHSFQRVEADRLRITAYETNGSKSARIYEVRIYDEPST